MARRLMLGQMRNCRAMVRSMATAVHKVFDPALSSRLLVIIALYALADVSPSSAAEPDRAAVGQREEKRAQLLQQMTALAQATEVRYPTGDRQPRLITSPVFRYDDQPRRFLDATMWVWTDRGRPVAFQKVEAMPQAWQYCLTSVSDDLLVVKWANGHEYRSTKPGVTFRPLADAPAVPKGNATRKLVVRKLIREFSARILIDADANISEEMRLLTTPIYEYDEAGTDVLYGAVFGFATNGTNPDVLVMIEARVQQDQNAAPWRQAAARMTNGGVTLKYRGDTVAEFEYVEPRSAGFPTWTFFATPREADTASTGVGSTSRERVSQQSD